MKLIINIKPLEKPEVNWSMNMISILAINKTRCHSGSFDVIFIIDNRHLFLAANIT